jgi:hypothetical protein
MTPSKLMAAAVLAVLALSGIAITGAVRAGQHPEIRVLDRANASSACIGDPATPSCAVETLLACRIRGEEALCAAVGLDLVALEAVAERLHGGPSGPDPFTVLDARAAEYRIDHVSETGDGGARVSLAARFHGNDGLGWPEAGMRRLKYVLHREDGAWWVDNVSWQPLVRFIDGHEAASRCIGDVRTPVCTVETHIACRVRSDAELCAKAGRVEGKHFRPKGATVTYMVTRIRRWEPPEPPAPGTIFVIVETMEVTQWEPGSRSGEQGGASDSGSDPVFVRPGFVAVSYTLERRAGEWRVTGRAERP